MAPQPKPKKQVGLNARRLAIVERAFKKFDKDNSGVIDIEDMKKTYDVSRHPRVLDGTMSASMVREMFLNQFEPCAATRDGKVTWDEFQTYYTKLGQEIDLGRELDHDSYFELVVSKAWRLDEDDTPKLGGTKIIPKTLDKPTGLAATQRMDLVWPSKDDEDVLVGFKGVVKPVFARADLPETIRGFFAFQDETARLSHTYLKAEAALTANFDLIWEVEPDSGVYCGFEGIIISSVDLKQLPAELQLHVVSPKVSTEKKVHYLTIEEKVNPFYKKSSQTYGVGAMKHCEQVAALKKSVWDGDSKGAVFAGRTGKFSRDFGGGMYRNSGLNVNPNPSASKFSVKQ